MQRNPHEERTPPYSLESEMSVLGAFLIDASHAYDEAADMLGEEDFYRDSHRVLWRAVVDLYDTEGEVDPVLLMSWLKDRELVEVAGGASYLSELMDAVPTAANCRYHAKLVREKSKLRQLIRGAEQIILDATRTQGRALEEIMDGAEQRIFRISDSEVSDELTDAKALMWRCMERLEEGAKVGLDTGFSDLDRMTNGMLPGELWIIAGRPSMGKSAAMLDLALNLSTGNEEAERHPVGIFSLEMSKEDLMDRAIANLGRVNMKELHRRVGAGDAPTMQEAKALEFASVRLAPAKLWIDDYPILSIGGLRAKARRMKKNHGLRVLFVDYLQLMQGSNRENRQQDISEISRGLKLLAKELEITVVALSQLSRAVESREDKRPVLSDLRESGAIEQDADKIIFLYRPEYYYGERDDKGNNLVGLADWLLRKCRGGETGPLTLFFEGEYTRFSQRSNRSEQAYG